MLPNLSSLSLATGVLVPASERWGHDPVTLEPWKKGQYGWLLKTYHKGKDGEPGKFKHERYLYNIEKLARWLLQNPTSPMTRQRADEQDMEDCIAEANRLRKLAGEVSLQEEMARGGAQAEAPVPLMVRRRDPYLNEVDPDAVAEHNRRADEERRRVSGAERGEDLS